MLRQINIWTSSNQFLFTYTNRKNEMNVQVHIDYLNYRMKSIQRRHPELAHATPHKLITYICDLSKRRRCNYSRGITSFDPFRY